MKKLAVMAMAALLLASASAQPLQPPQPASHSDMPTQMRSLQGQVMGEKDVPLPEAVVYLKNTKTLTIHTFIANKNGEYQFNALSRQVDYEVHAEFAGKKSDVKTLSTFDNRAKAYINLKIAATGK